MIVAIAPLTICILSLVLIRSVLMDRYGPLFLNNLENQMEDEVDYVSLQDANQIQDYDWSPPNGELPDDYKVDHPLASYLNGEDMRNGQDLRESWLDENTNVLFDAPKVELKRGFDFGRNKKNQVLCRVQRAIHHHSETGYEFFPKSYTSYSCHPVKPAQVDGSLTTSHDTCYVTGDNCITIEKEQLFLKRRHNTNCWTHFIEAIGAGCKCLSKKY